MDGRKVGSEELQRRFVWCKRAWKRVGPGGASQGSGAVGRVGQQRPPWVSWELLPSTVEYTWRVSVYVGMVWGLSFAIISILPPPTVSPGSFCSEMPRRGKVKVREKDGGKGEGHKMT